MPRHDFSPSKPRRDVGGKSFTPGFADIPWTGGTSRKRKPGKDRDRGGVPVEPDRPRDLSGGAAAPLEYDD